jgi:protein phosphatase 1 regulatory subunit 11
MRAWARSRRKVGTPTAIQQASTNNHIVCCIYHKPRAADESSDDDSSDDSSDSDSDSEPDNSTARPADRTGGSRGRRPHQHDHDDCGDEHDHGEGSGKPLKKRQRRKPSPNAYEKMPKQKK